MEADRFRITVELQQMIAGYWRELDLNGARDITDFYVEDCRFVAGPGPTQVEQIYRDIAAAHPDDVVSVDMDRKVCPYLPICDPVVKGLIVRWDSAHITNAFATTPRWILPVAVRGMVSVM